MRRGIKGMFCAAALALSLCCCSVHTTQETTVEAGSMETAQSVIKTGENVIKPTETASNGDEIVSNTPETVSEAEETEAADQSLIGSLDWGAEDAEILLKIAMAEAEGEDTEGKALVMLVVLNRVWSDDFPDSIEAVVFQENQFSPVKDGGRYYTTEPDEDCYAALALIQSGWDESMGALYFESEENADNWHSNNLTYLFQHGNHRFYK